jgi:hypothetical protein
MLVVLLCLSATAFEVVMIGDRESFSCHVSHTHSTWSHARHAVWNALLHKFGNPSVALDINPYVFPPSR